MASFLLIIRWIEEDKVVAINNKATAITDTALPELVRQELQWNTQLSMTEIRILARQGVLTLAGTVSSFAPGPPLRIRNHEDGYGIENPY